MLLWCNALPTGLTLASTHDLARTRCHAAAASCGPAAELLFGRLCVEHTLLPRALRALRRDARGDLATTPAALAGPQCGTARVLEALCSHLHKRADRSASATLGAAAAAFDAPSAYELLREAHAAAARIGSAASVCTGDAIDAVLEDDARALEAAMGCMSLLLGEDCGAVRETLAATGERADAGGDTPPLPHAPIPELGRGVGLLLRMLAALPQPGRGSVPLEERAVSAWAPLYAGGAEKTGTEEVRAPAHWQHAQRPCALFGRARACTRALGAH